MKIQVYLLRPFRKNSAELLRAAALKYVAMVCAIFLASLNLVLVIKYPDIPTYCICLYRGFHRMIFWFENLKNLIFLVKAQVHKNKNASPEIISPHCVRAGVVHLFQLSSATSFGLHRYSIVVQQILMRSFRCELWQNSSIFSIMNNMIQMSCSSHRKRNTDLLDCYFMIFAVIS